MRRTWSTMTTTELTHACLSLALPVLLWLAIYWYGRRLSIRHQRGQRAIDAWIVYDTCKYFKPGNIVWVRHWKQRGKRNVNQFEYKKAVVLDANDFHIRCRVKDGKASWYGPSRVEPSAEESL